RPVNDKPTAGSFSATTDEDVAVSVTLQGNDVETAAANLTYTITQSPANGVLSGSGMNLTYTPNPNFNGTDTIKYTVTDRGDPDNCSGAPSASCSAALTSYVATVTITVRPVNDAPTADDRNASLDEDS